MRSRPGEGEPVDAADERIESYLDELLLRLRGHPRQARRLLSEVDGHLRESVEAGLAAGLDKPHAVDEALKRIGPPSAAARGLPSLTAYRVLLAQMTEAALLVISMLLLAAGAAAIPAAMVGITGNPDLVTGDSPALSQGRCPHLPRMPAGTGCEQVLVGHLQDVIRDHLLTGWLGFLLLAAWWVLHVHRQTRPALLPGGFALTVCSTLLGVAGSFLLAAGIADVARGIDSAGGVIGSGDLVATGATMMAAALLAWVALARQAARPARNMVQ